MGKQPQPTEEELEFVYNQLKQGLSNSEVQEELRDQPFTPREDGRYFRQRRKEFNAAKRVFEEVGQAKLDPIAIEARRQHFDDLREIIKKWKDDMLGDQGNILVPTTFREGDGTVGSRERGPLCWSVNSGGDVAVWLTIERHRDLFESLTIHLPPDVVSTYLLIKRKLGDGIINARTSPPTVVNVLGVTELVARLLRQLDRVLATRVFREKCQICIDIDNYTMPDSQQTGDEPLDEKEKPPD